ncbi:hypothetical protein BKA83DRAFT_4486737 [Pisolithus microcarpus]|nr:hypothetical protein BKA83DRAFT_4486737 [Pisolithus microcarpus]
MQQTTMDGKWDVDAHGSGVDRNDQVTIMDGKNMVTLDNKYGDKTHEQIMGKNAGTLDVKQRAEARKPEGESDHVGQANDVAYTMEQADDIYTRKCDPFNPRRVEHILRAVKIGEQLTSEEREQAEEFVKEYADVFTCTIGEVCLIPGAKIDLNVPDDAVLTTSV